MMSAARPRPVLSIVSTPPVQQSFIAARQEMLRAWQRLSAEHSSLDELNGEIEATENAMRSLMRIERG